MFKPKLSIPVFILIILTIGIAFAQLDTPSEKPIISPRKPAISSDGKMIAFVYQGDIWTVPSSGGHAVRLTDNVEQDTIPIFSPDGQWIAFSSLRTGNYDAFIVPTEGGTPRQMTFHGSDERATDWSPDGKRIIFSAYRDVPDLAMYEIDVNTLRTYVVGTEFKGATYASYSLDGKNVTYQKYGFPWIRPRYRGSASAQIWTIARETGKRHEVTKTDGQHLWPKFLPDGRTIISVATGQATPTKANFFEKPTKNVDNAARTPNLWAFNLNGRGRQITKFVGDSVKWPSVARQTGDIVFEYYDSIYLLKKGAKEPVKLTIFAATDDKENSLHRETVTEGVEEAEPSSDGKTILFRVNSDLWTVPVEKPKKRNPDDATRLTDNAGWDGDFNWTKDGKKIFFVSDREGPLSLFEMNPETQEVKLRFKASGDVFNPQITPDDKKVAFWVCDEGLYMMPIEGGTAVKVLDIPGTGSWQGMQTEFTFSPDMKWVAYINTAANNIADVWISPVKGGAAVNITRLKTNHSQVKWSPDGKYLFFQGDRQGFGLYVVPLKREPAVVADLEMKLDMPKDNAAVKVDIDFEDINLRIRKHNGLNPSGDLNILSDGTIIYINNGDVWSLTFDGKDSKRRTTRGDISLMRVLPDGKRAMLIAGRKMWMMDLDKYNLSEVKFVANWQVDARLELKAAFAQYWSGINRWYYDANFHGRDWAAIRAHYEPLLEGVSTRNEFADLLNMMMGEIDSSHAEVHPRPGGPPSPGGPGLGLLLDYKYDGPGIHIKEVPEGSTGTYPQTLVKSGEYIMAINGIDVKLDEYLYRTLIEVNGKDLQLLVNSKPTKEGARIVNFGAGGSWPNYENRIKRTRKLIDKLSGGRIAYVHLQGMNDHDLNQFDRIFYEEVIGKDAAIVDVRFNGGGYIADTMASWLTIRPYGYSVSRKSYPENWPEHSWNKPLAVLINEFSLSNAEMFPLNAKYIPNTKVFGIATPGYVIGTVSFNLLDGTVARMPGNGRYRADGSNMENNGEKPDVKVDITQEEWEAQQDPQIEAAVAFIMKKLGKK